MVTEKYYNASFISLVIKITECSFRQASLPWGTTYIQYFSNLGVKGGEETQKF